MSSYPGVYVRVCARVRERTFFLVVEFKEDQSGS